MPQCTCSYDTAAVCAQRQKLLYTEMITFTPTRVYKVLEEDVTPINVFPLMRLPWEIRQRIYYLHFQQPKKQDAWGAECPAGDRCPIAVYNDFVPVRELILANKLVYHEAMPIYYRTKTFIFESVQSLWRFLRIIGPIQRSHVAHICFTLRGTRERYGFRLLADCPRLQSLEIILSGSYRSPFVLNHLLQVRGLKSVKLTVPPNFVNLDHFKASLEVLVMPYNEAVTPPGPARAFALQGKPRTYFGANESTKRACSAPMPRGEATDSEKTGTVLTRARKGLEHDQRQTMAKRIKIEAHG